MVSFGGSSAKGTRLWTWNTYIRHLRCILSRKDTVAFDSAPADTRHVDKQVQAYPPMRGWEHARVWGGRVQGQVPINDVANSLVLWGRGE